MNSETKSEIREIVKMIFYASIFVIVLAGIAWLFHATDDARKDEQFLWCVNSELKQCPDRSDFGREQCFYAALDSCKYIYGAAASEPQNKSGAK